MYPSTPWLLARPTSQGPAIRLFCLPNAGGAASGYAPWRTRMPAFVDVLPIQLPGRENRHAEPAIADADELVGQLVDVLAAYDDLPFAVFGHSMGAGLAFHAVQGLEKRGLPGPVRLFASSFRAPHLPSRHPRFSSLHGAAFLEALNRLGGLSPELVADPEYMDLLMPALRADMTLVDQLEEPGTPVGCPITALGGTEDERVARYELEGWELHTRASHRTRMFPGGHFYLREQPDGVVNAIAEELTLDLELGRRADRAGVSPADRTP